MDKQSEQQLAETSESMLEFEWASPLAALKVSLKDEPSEMLMASPMVKQWVDFLVFSLDKHSAEQ